VREACFEHNVGQAIVFRGLLPTAVGRRNFMKRRTNRSVVVAVSVAFSTLPGGFSGPSTG
jgi:hypothetical protein